MSRLRIALVAHGIHFRGGMERNFAELASAFCREHDVHLFTAEAGNVPVDLVTLHPVPVVSKPIAAKFLQFYARSSQMLRKERFDVVHTIGGITARQDIVTAQYCQYAWGDAIAREPGAGEGVTAYHQMMWRLTGYFEKQAMNSRYTQIISANSQRTKTDLETFYGTDPGKIHVIYNGVDPVRFTPENRKGRAEIRRRYGIREEARLLLFVGEYRRKGLANIIRALGQLQRPDVHLLAVGRGEQSHFAGLAEAAGVQNQVTLAGPASDIECVFGAADAFVFPTLYEPFGMVITEAMASGLPVITSRRAGAAEMIEDNVSGLLLDTPGDVQELTSAIERVLSSDTNPAVIGSKARRSVVGYDWAKVAAETMSLYEGIQQSQQKKSFAAHEAGR